MHLAGQPDRFNLRQFLRWQFRQQSEYGFIHDFRVLFRTACRYSSGGETVSCAPVVFCRMERTEAFRMRRKTANIIISKEKTGLFFRQSRNCVENILAVLRIQRAKPCGFPFNIDCPGPRLLIPVHARPMSQNTLEQYPGTHSASGESCAEPAVAFGQIFGLAGSGKTFRMQSKSVKRDPASGPFFQFDHLIRQEFFLTGTARNHIVKTKSRLFHKPVPFSLEFSKNQKTQQHH